MTARQYPEGTVLNSKGTGRGMKTVNKPITKKRGASADREPVIAVNRKNYVSASNIPTSEIAERIDPNKPLTAKAIQFVKFWAQGETIANASVRAGYGDGASYAYKLVHFPQALILYKEEKRLFEEANQMTRKKVMDGLLEGIDMAKMMAEPTAVINGWKTIGQMCGYFEPIKHKIEVSVNGSIAIEKLNTLTDEELFKLIEDHAGTNNDPPNLS
jgi:hypothetical protein